MYRLASTCVLAALLSAGMNPATAYAVPSPGNSTCTFPAFIPPAPVPVTVPVALRDEFDLPVQNAFVMLSISLETGSLEAGQPLIVNGITDPDGDVDLVFSNGIAGHATIRLDVTANGIQMAGSELYTVGLPDQFVHAQTPHLMAKNSFAPLSATDQLGYMAPQVGARPLMIILLEFPDAPHGAFYTPAYFEDLFFGPDPSVNGYYREVSYDQFEFANAGVVGWVEAPESAANYYFGPTDATDHYTELGAAAVQAAIDDGVDFSAYDTNGDNVVTRDELLIEMIFAPHTPYMGQKPWVMATRLDQGQPDGVTTPGGLEIDTWAVRGEQYGTLGLFAHELAHGALNLPDLYNDTYGGDPSGPYSLMSVSGYAYAPHFSAWAKLHLGWLQPVVVTESGYYSVPAAEQDPTAYILYDWSRGPDEYFIVENRWPPSSLYESGMPDRGLAVWHITEFYDDEPFNFLKGRKMVAMKWAGGDGAVSTAPYTGLWDCAESASCYDLTPISTPRDSRWEDGSNSRLAIREIPDAAETVVVYFDIGSPSVSVESPRTRATMLYANAPNPVRTSTTIRYDLANRGRVAIGVFDVAGRRVAALESGEQAAGTHRVEWRPQELESGVYYYRLEVDGALMDARKLVLIR